MEKKHADHLARKDLDEESRLQVIYHILKEQLRKAKGELLELKKNRDKDLKRAIAFKKQLRDIDKDPKGSLAYALEPELSDLNIVQQLKYAGPENISPQLKAVIEKLLSEDAKKHYRYCPCCHNYEKGREPSAQQMGEFLEYVRQQHYLVKSKRVKKLKPRD